MAETFNIVPLSPEEEDTLIQRRVANDDRVFKRLSKALNKYMISAYPTLVELATPSTSSVEEAREGFLLEAASFQLMLRRSQLVCDAEQKQADEYRKEKQRIVDEHTVLRNDIEELKAALERAQLERRRKIEYDQIAEKINLLPSREELELSIGALESDMQVIHDEHATQDRSILARKEALDSIVTDLNKLRLFGKEQPKPEESGSRAPSEAPETESPTAADAAAGMEVERMTEAEISEGEKETEKDGKEQTPHNTSAKPRQSVSLLQTATDQLRVKNSQVASNPGTPVLSRSATPLLTPTIERDSSPLSAPDSPVDENREDGEANEEGEEGEEDEDIEMGEVSEKEKGGGRVRVPTEDREEGEASDESSVLSDPPDE